MNVALDIDGSISRRPEFFAVLSRAIRESGGKVFVVTSRSSNAEVERQTRRELRSWGVQFDRLVVIPDGDRGRICPLLLAPRIPLLKAPRHPCQFVLALGSGCWYGQGIQAVDVAKGGVHEAGRQVGSVAKGRGPAGGSVGGSVGTGQ
jgi:hypothetical protein